MTQENTYSLLSSKCWLSSIDNSTACTTSYSMSKYHICHAHILAWPIHTNRYVN